MRHVHLATAIVLRDGCALLVASHYPNHPQPLWNLPGGRQHDGELLADTAVRECFEETGYRVAVSRLAYVGESYDPLESMHFINAAFAVTLLERDAARFERDANDHVVDVAWVPIGEIAQRISVPVVRDPLLGYLNGTLEGYAGFADAGITIRWPSGSQ